MSAGLAWWCRSMLRARAASRGRWMLLRAEGRGDAGERGPGGCGGPGWAPGAAVPVEGQQRRPERGEKGLLQAGQALVLAAGGVEPLEGQQRQGQQPVWEGPSYAVRSPDPPPPPPRVRPRAAGSPLLLATGSPVPAAIPHRWRCGCPARRPSAAPAVAAPARGRQRVCWGPSPRGTPGIAPGPQRSFPGGSGGLLPAPARPPPPWGCRDCCQRGGCWRRCAGARPDCARAPRTCSGGCGRLGAGGHPARWATSPPCPARGRRGRWGRRGRRPGCPG